MPAAPLPPIRRALIVELLRQLDIAREEIDQALRAATSADVARRLQRQRAEIERVFGVFRASATKAAHASADAAWAGGITHAGVTDAASRINTRALLAIRVTLTDRIQNVSVQAIRQINTALTQHLLGVRTLSQTVSDIQAIMDHAPRWSAMRIAYTEVSRAYNTAHYEALLEQARRIPGLRKRWRHSGKERGRLGHIHAAQQAPIPVDEPFEIVDPKTGEVEQLRYPGDPNASAKNTIFCGCMLEAVLPGADEIFAGPIGPIVKPGDAVRDGAPVEPPSTAAEPAPAAPETAPEVPAAPRPSRADSIFAGPIGPIVRPGTIVRNGVTIVEPPAPSAAAVRAVHAPGGILSPPAEAPAAPFRPERAPWAPGFPTVGLHATERTVKQHAAYAAAKAGDLASAARLVEDLVSTDVIDDLVEHYARLRPILVPVHAEESGGKNIIPLALAMFIRARTGWSVETALIQANKVGRTGQDGYFRLAIQPLFEGPASSGAYFLVDDFLGQGATFANLRGHIVARGGTVVGATALTGKPPSAMLALSPSTLSELRAVHGPSLLENWWRDFFGYGFESLTESEARYLIRRTDADRIRKEILARLGEVR